MNAVSLSAPDARPDREDLSERYLSLKLGDESCAVPIQRVVEILPMLSLTGQAGRAGSVKGVLNLRGRTIPVLDLRPIPHSPSGAVANRSCVVVLQTNGAASPHGALVGLIADAIEEVIDIPASRIAASVAVGSRLDAACLLGIANVHGVFRSLLDIDRAAALGRTIPSSRMSRRVPAFA